MSNDNIFSALNPVGHNELDRTLSVAPMTTKQVFSKKFKTVGIKSRENRVFMLKVIFPTIPYAAPFWQWAAIHNLEQSFTSCGFQ